MEPLRAWGGTGKGRGGLAGPWDGGPTWGIWAFRVGRAQSNSLESKPPRREGLEALVFGLPKRAPRTGLLTPQLASPYFSKGIWGQRQPTQREEESGALEAPVDLRGSGKRDQI